jgi:thymidylate synthase ThyX
MSQIKAKIIADSINPQGDRLTTFILTFPRFILAELNTHRMFSRNSASSRAIPFKKMIESVKENPFIPIAWQKEHKGMQGNEYFTDETQIHFRNQSWLKAIDNAVRQAIELNAHQVTKQLVNRLLESFMWHTVILTTGKEGLDNFFELRCPQYEVEGLIFRSKKDAGKAFYGGRTDDYTNFQWLQMNKGQSEIHMMALAEAIWDSYNESSPKQLQSRDWHIPFDKDLYKRGISDDLEQIADKEFSYNEVRIKIATARCARVSYTVVGEEGKEFDYQKDIELHNKLLESKHLSPFEHCARVMSEDEYYNYSHCYPVYDNHQQVDGQDDDFGWCRNYRGFIQYRSLIN